MAEPIFATLLVLASFVLVAQDAFAQKDEAKHSKSTLRFSVTNTSNAPIGDVEIEVLKWTGKLECFGALGKTDSEGKATIEVPYSEDYFYIKFLCNGYASGQRALQLSRGESQIDFKLSRPVQGWINLTADGKPLAVAEFSFFEITDANKSKSYLNKVIAETFGLKMNVSDAQGRLAGGSFELRMSRLPYDPDGEGMLTTVFALAFDPLTNRSGMAQVDLTDPKATENIRLEITERPVDWPLTAVKRPEQDEKTLALLQELFAKQRKEFEKGTAGNSVPPMTEGTWLNTEARSLEAFLGRYVLLDFWFIGCGPCERDFPAVKLAHKKFSDHGFSVVGVHINDQLPADVQKFADDKEMSYPIVVDNADGSILKQYRELGVNSFPTYILLDPEGRIVHNDHASDRSDTFGGHSLRMNKLEIVYKVIGDLVEATPK